MAFFTGLHSIEFKTELRYYLKKNSGYPEIYFVKCTNYPKCRFNISSLPSDKIKLKEINDMFSYSIFKTEAEKLIAQEQYVLLVYCKDDTDCPFQTNFYSELNQIVLSKDTRTYHTIMEKGENNFLIKLNDEKEYKQIYINFLTYTGDISIKTKLGRDRYIIKEYLTGNKKYFILDVNNKSTEINNELYFIVKG